jgi:hypothetical protein
MAAVSASDRALEHIDRLGRVRMVAGQQLLWAGETVAPDHRSNASGILASRRYWRRMLWNEVSGRQVHDEL